MKNYIPLCLFLSACGPMLFDDTDDGPDEQEDPSTQPPSSPEEQLPPEEEPVPVLEESLSFSGDTVTFRVQQGQGELRSYAISSDHPLRDGNPSNGQIMVEELPGQMYLRSGSIAWDALFAMAMQEVRQASVGTITDGSFGDLSCDCFETGEQWRWVWTRDTAYAVEHALGMVDPQRSANALRFKISDRKDAVGESYPVIVQDTGSGGSWPVSTDRAIWSIGAWEVLKYLEGQAREDFLEDAYTAMVNTLEEDRQYVFDATDGLYRGEQSFLDWREQSYPSWTASDTVHIASSKSLSTNIAHWRMMWVVEQLALEQGATEDAERYGQWREDLGQALEDNFWANGFGRYLAMKMGPLDPSIPDKRDLLGQSMMAMWLSNESRASQTVSNYPHAEGGPPVLWPQQPFIPIYHNRGVWPFVTAYDLRAAKRASNAAVFSSDLNSLIRGAALNLSNMENFEFLSGANWVDDGEFSGPVVNSRRQLWSVAGYLAAFVKGVFGVDATQDGLVFSPFLTAQDVQRWLPGVESLTLHHLPYKGANLDITLRLPSQPMATGSYYFSRAEVGGEALSDEPWTPSGDTSVDLILEEGMLFDGDIREVGDGDFQLLWGPREPSLTSLTAVDGDLQLTFDADGEEGVEFYIYRDGVMQVGGLTSNQWTDTNAVLSESPCYAVETRFPSGNVSHHSEAVCWWGEEGERVRVLDATDFTVSGGSFINNHGREHYEGWGNPDHTLEVSFTAEYSGTHWLQAVYGNGAGAVNTGITAAHKSVVIEDDQGTEVGTGSWIMPHLGSWDQWADSTIVSVELSAGETYTIRVGEAPNMSYLARHQSYSGLGGGDEVYNDVNIASIKLLARP